MNTFLFTSESVTEGHPDKVCDQISDAILDAILWEDRDAHVACETSVTTGMVLVMGEITTKCNPDIPQIVRSVLKKIGYVGSDWGFSNEDCAILTSIHKQSEDIARGVNESIEARQGSKNNLDDCGAGDQGMMFGYACDETKELMPLSLSLAHKLAKRLAEVRKSGEVSYLGPDGKTQVTIEYDEKFNPIRIDTVVVSTQHLATVSNDSIFKDIVEKVIKPVIPKELYDENVKIYVNPTGRFVIGGPKGDSGLTGRKIIVDTYGGFAAHGGGAFSGKDPSKVDRSGAYMARYIAKNVVAAGLARRCEVQIAYAIGVAKPVSLYVNTYGTGTCSDSKLIDAIKNTFDLRPSSIINHLELKEPIYTELASYGHMGREELGVKWEVTDKCNELINFLSH